MAKRGRQPRNSKPKRGIGAKTTIPGQALTGKPAGKAATKAVQMAKRRHRALDLYVNQELSMQKVAEILTREGLPCTAKTVNIDLATALDELRAETLMTAAKYREVELQRSLRNDRAILPLLYGQVKGRTTVVGEGKKAKLVTEAADPAVVVSAQTRAHQRLTDSGRHRASLLGLNAPLKIAPTNPSGTSRYHDLSEEDLEREIAACEAELGIGPVVGDGKGGPGDDAEP